MHILALLLIIVICNIPHQFSFKYCLVDHDLYFTIFSIKKAGEVFFTHFIPFQPSGEILYRNQSYDLQFKSNDWFPYEVQYLTEMG